jgi:hypothetical protein
MSSLPYPATLSPGNSSKFVLIIPHHAPLHSFVHAGLRSHFTIIDLTVNLRLTAQKQAYTLTVGSLWSSYAPRLFLWYLNRLLRRTSAVRYS